MWGKNFNDTVAVSHRVMKKVCYLSIYLSIYLSQNYEFIDNNNNNKQTTAIN